MLVQEPVLVSFFSSGEAARVDSFCYAWHHVTIAHVPLLRCQGTYMLSNLRVHTLLHAAPLDGCHGQVCCCRRSTMVVHAATQVSLGSHTSIHETAPTHSDDAAPLHLVRH